ncbi:MAG TPA: hypothetical protein VL308_19550 [Gemmatimonadaceae bacterium]|jgi:hypothetical protein|nr:hypothetical protein [Gemmatimonadaceae bacterium]
MSPRRTNALTIQPLSPIARDARSLSVPAIGEAALESGVANGSKPVRAGNIEAIDVAASGIGTGSGAPTTAGASANPNPASS